jgi:hypothetical protein
VIETRGERLVFSALPNAVPSPRTIVAPVFNDVMTRTLIVGRPEGASGYDKLLWRESHRALEQAVDSGWQGHDFLWGGAFGDRQIVHGSPGPDFLSLAFHFPTGVEVYRQLVSKPGLYALVTADRNLRRFMAVKFLHR